MMRIADRKDAIKVGQSQAIDAAALAAVAEAIEALSGPNKAFCRLTHDFDDPRCPAAVASPYGGGSATDHLHGIGCVAAPAQLVLSTPARTCAGGLSASLGERSWSVARARDDSAGLAR